MPSLIEGRMQVSVTWLEKELFNWNFGIVKDYYNSETESENNSIN